MQKSVVHYKILNPK